MKKFLATLTIGILILTGGCSNTAATTEAFSAAPISSPESSMQDNASGDTSDTKSRPSDTPRRDSQHEVLGKITAISENKITLAIGSMSIPEDMQGERGTPPADDSPQPKDGQPRHELSDDGSRPDDARSDGSAPQKERPADGNKKGSGGGFSAASMDLEYTGEEMSYTLSDSIEITKRNERNGEKLTASDLAEGDIVRLLLDEAEQPVSIQIFGTSK